MHGSDLVWLAKLWTLLGLFAAQAEAWPAAGVVWGSAALLFGYGLWKEERDAPTDPAYHWPGTSGP